MQLQAIGDFAPLDISIDESLFKKELKQYEDKWAPIQDVKVLLTIEKDCC